MYKTAGVILFSLIPMILSFSARRKVIQAGKCREALILFLEYTDFQIEHFSKAQDEIFFSFEHNDLEKCGFLPTLQGEVKKNPVGAMERSLACLEEEGNFSKEEWDVLTHFAKNFGMQSKETQLADFRKTISFFKAEEEKAKEKRKNDAAVIRAVGLCLGIGLFILLM